MRALLVFLLFLVFALFARWYWVCQVHGICDDNKSVEDVRLKTLSLTDGGREVYSGFDQFAFDPGDFRPRLNDNNRLFLDTIKAYLRADSSRNLTIIAYSRVSEKGQEIGIYENLGLARAAVIRRALIDDDVAESRISLDHGLSEDESLREPLLFEIFTTPDEFQVVQFSFTNMTYSDANFAFNSADFKPGEACRNYLDSVKIYVEKNPETIIEIIGHTDNKGTQKYNLDLGKRRAENAREYLTNIGVTTEIKINSKGESEPIAPNEIANKDNPEGRQKNRRVQFVLQDETT